MVAATAGEADDNNQALHPEVTDEDCLSVLEEWSSRIGKDQLEALRKAREGRARVLRELGFRSASRE